MNTNNVRYRMKLLDLLSVAKDLAGKTLVMYNINGSYNTEVKEAFISQPSMREITEVQYSNRQFTVGYRRTEHDEVEIDKLNLCKKQHYVLGRLRDGSYVA